MLSLKRKLELRAKRAVEQLVSIKFTSGTAMVELHTDLGYANKVDSVISVPCQESPHNLMADVLSELEVVARANIAGYEDSIADLQENVKTSMSLVMKGEELFYSIENEASGMSLKLRIVGNDICPLHLGLVNKCDLSNVQVHLTKAFFEQGYGLIGYGNVDGSEVFKPANGFDIVNVSEETVQEDDQSFPLLDANVVRFYDELRAAVLLGNTSELFTIKHI